MGLTPWYKVVTPREDLREGRPLDAAEFAVHLDQVRDHRAPPDYQSPDRFFERTYMTRTLSDLASQVLRRLSGEVTETSAVFNMTTQFGGGKTHALTLLYHLARQGPGAEQWQGVKRLLDTAGVPRVPKAETAVFVGTEFDSLTGRGGNDGTPLRRTPWGEIAYQLGGSEALAIVAEHDKQGISPAGDVIRRMLPRGRPCLILLDELMNYISRNRSSGLGSQLYDFVQNLSEVARGEKGVVLAVSIPASEIEMTADDEADYERLKKMLDRVGKAMLMSAESETSEIIRRRLFEWCGLPEAGKRVCRAHAEWVRDYRDQLPDWFPFDGAYDAFADAYPFHPCTLSVFERKWQSLPRFQRTRGILRLLALWVSLAYRDGYKGVHRDPLIGLGTAPLEDPTFRAALFEQLGENRLEVVVTTDICGKQDAHAENLDKSAIHTIKKARLHRKAATSVFFESNGGQALERCTLRELRLDVCDPSIEIGNIETVMEALSPPNGACYYLHVEQSKYYFSTKATLTKVIADRKTSVKADEIKDLVRERVKDAMGSKPGLEIVLFPEKSGDIADRPALTLVVLAPEQTMEQEQETRAWIESVVRDHGSSARTFKNALIFAVPESDSTLKSEAKDLLALKAIQEDTSLQLDDRDKRELPESIRKAERDLQEAVWRSYNKLIVLTKDYGYRTIDLGLGHSSEGESLVAVYVSRLEEADEIVTAQTVNPRKIVENWAPAFVEWPTEQVRDAFYSSPRLPRVLHKTAIASTIARGVSDGVIGYFTVDSPEVRFGVPTSFSDIKISDEAYIVTAEEAMKRIGPPVLAEIRVIPKAVGLRPGAHHRFLVQGFDQHAREMPVPEVEWSATGGEISADGIFKAGSALGLATVSAVVGDLTGQAEVIIGEDEGPGPSVVSITWQGNLPHQRWIEFYQKVLSVHAASGSVESHVRVDIRPSTGTREDVIGRLRASLKELGLPDDLEVS